MSEPTTVRSSLWKRRVARRRLRRRIGTALVFATGVLAALIALMAYGIMRPPEHQLTATEVSDTVAQVLASATPPPANSDLVYQVIQPSLVLIETKGPNVNGKPDEGLGSGVVINANGDILTALHVVTQATDIQLTFADGSQSGAEVINTQPENDIAVVRATKPPAQFFPATLGNPRSMRIGDEAYAVGNPLGLYGSMSAGVISGLNRTFKAPDSGQRMQGLIQFDAAVNPGNSGGPLLNRAGEVIGIVTGLVNPTGADSFAGIGFAVPINAAGGAAGAPLD